MRWFENLLPVYVGIAFSLLLLAKAGAGYIEALSYEKKMAVMVMEKQLNEKR